MRLTSVLGYKLGIWLLGLMAFASFSASPVLAKTGVGVGIAQIKPDKFLNPGTNIQLGVIPVINTGDTPRYYNLDLTYDSRNDFLKPPSEWFSFSPQSFYLAQGKEQNVSVTLKLPDSASEGVYFAYIEARPLETPDDTKIGIAAATKLEFTVKTSAVLGATDNRRTWVRPLSVVLVFILLASLIFLAIKKTKRIFQSLKPVKRPSPPKEVIIWSPPPPSMS